jgi:asparagine synthase (glutamine-hydrolysing)
VSLRGVIAFSGWPEALVPGGAWSGADAAGRPLALAHVPVVSRGPATPVASNEDRSVRAVLAGTLYNRRELRAHLGGRHAFSGREDAEIVVHLYEERDVQCVKALRGPFTLVLWDGRAGRLLLARDQLGLLPLYYVVDGRRLGVASALAALAALPGTTGTWDATALDAFLALGTVPAPATFHPAIRQLRPGELGLWEDGRLRLQRYWQLAFPERRMARRDVAAVLREQVLDALRLRQAGVAAGLLLSGGLGAASVLALAALERRPPARAYTAAPAGLEDEGRHAARLAARAGVEHVIVDEGVDWGHAAELLLAAHGAPAGDPSAAVLHLAAARAAADVTVALVGSGAEEVFGGSAAVRSADRLRRFHRLPALVREAVEVWTRVAPAGRTAGLRTLVGAERLAPLELWARANALFSAEEREDLYTEDLRAALEDARPWAAAAGLLSEAIGAGASEPEDVLYFVDLALRLPAEAAAALPAAAVGLDLRFPLADHRLAQFVASVPATMRGNARERALLLRGAVADLVPATVLRRAHASAVPPPRAWVTGSLRELLEDTLAPARIAAQGVFRPEAVSRLCQEHLAGRRDHGRQLWALVLAVRWIERRALDARPETASRVAG